VRFRTILVLISLVFLCMSAIGQENTADYWLQNGNEYFLNSSYELAERCYSKAIEINPEDAEAWNGKGMALCSQDKHEEAIMAYDRAIEINPLDAMSWNNKGIALGFIRRYDDGIKAFDRAIEIDPLNDDWRIIVLRQN
jgi:tetratricopeptide (TPR) repeat protein